jgi:hypothetical protein
MGVAAGVFYVAAVAAVALGLTTTLVIAASFAVVYALVVVFAWMTK